MTSERLAELARPKQPIKDPPKKAPATPLPIPVKRVNTRTPSTPNIAKKKTRSSAPDVGHDMTSAELLSCLDPQDDPDAEVDPSIPPAPIAADLIQTSSIDNTTASDPPIAAQSTDESTVPLPPIKEWQSKIHCPTCYGRGTFAEFQYQGTNYKCVNVLANNKPCNVRLHRKWILSQIGLTQTPSASPENSTTELPAARSYFKTSATVTSCPTAVEIAQTKLAEIRSRLSNAPSNEATKPLIEGITGLFEILPLLLQGIASQESAANLTAPEPSSSSSSSFYPSRRKQAPLSTPATTTQSSFSEVTKRNLPKQKPTPPPRRHILEKIPADKQEIAKKALHQMTYRRPTPCL